MADQPIKKPELVVFSENVTGGVQNYYYNLLTHDLNDNFTKIWILIDNLFNNNTRPLKPFDTGFEKVFNYRSDTPLFHTLKSLQGFVSNEPGLVLLSFPIDLAVMHVYRKKNKTIGFVCHDEYFLQFATRYEFLIDFYIVHNPFFMGAIKKLLPHRQNDIYYLPFGIKLPEKKNKPNTTDVLKIIVIARMHQSKGVLDVPIIMNLLEEKNIPVLLTMVGNGPEKEKLQESFKENRNVTFATPKTTEELFDEICKHDIFLLPSYLDGMPVSLMETMSCGLVPVISDFNEGIKETVTADKGFILPKKDYEGFASAIALLHADRELLASMRDTVLSYSIQEFNIDDRSKNYYQLFQKYPQLKKKPRYKYIRYGKLIDHPAVPPWLHKNYYRTKTLADKLFH